MSASIVTIPRSLKTGRCFLSETQFKSECAILDTAPKAAIIIRAMLSRYSPILTPAPIAPDTRMVHHGHLAAQCHKSTAIPAGMILRVVLSRAAIDALELTAI